jgi:hypothetical protein
MSLKVKSATATQTKSKRTPLLQAPWLLPLCSHNSCSTIPVFGQVGVQSRTQLSHEYQLREQLPLVVCDKQTPTPKPHPCFFQTGGLGANENEDITESHQAIYHEGLVLKSHVLQKKPHSAPPCEI